MAVTDLLNQLLLAPPPERPIGTRGPSAPRSTERPAPSPPVSEYQQRLDRSLRETQRREAPPRPAPSENRISERDRLQSTDRAESKPASSPADSRPQPSATNRPTDADSTSTAPAEARPQAPASRESTAATAPTTPEAGPVDEKPVEAMLESADDAIFEPTATEGAPPATLQLFPAEADSDATDRRNISPTQEPDDETDFKSETETIAAASKVTGDSVSRPPASLAEALTDSKTGVTSTKPLVPGGEMPESTALPQTAAPGVPVGDLSPSATAQSSIKSGGAESPQVPATADDIAVEHNADGLTNTTAKNASGEESTSNSTPADTDVAAPSEEPSLPKNTHSPAPMIDAQAAPEVNPAAAGVSQRPKTSTSEASSTVAEAAANPTGDQNAPQSVQSTQKNPVNQSETAAVESQAPTSPDAATKENSDRESRQQSQDGRTNGPHSGTTSNTAAPPAFIGGIPEASTSASNAPVIAAPVVALTSAEMRTTPAEPVGDLTKTADAAGLSGTRETTPLGGIGKAAGSRPDVHRSEFLERVTHAVQQSVQEGRQLRIRLNPPELGVLQIEVSVKNGVVTARLEVQTSSAQQTLLEHMPMLREALVQQGTSLERIDVHLAAPQSDDGSSGSGHRGGRQDDPEARQEQQGQTEDRLPEESPQPPPGPRQPANVDELDIKI